ncbi:MAG: hypothetical protein HOP28_14180 [Gemmatimonadales bacterium]|nr:hypothetical protein [Gemmatimonadales bacterium]
MRRLVMCASLTIFAAAPAAAQRHDDQYYYPGAFNWTFLRVYPEAARLFNAFDYGHAILYERLSQGSAGVRAKIETDDFRFLTTDLLLRPPRFAIAEDAVMPRYARMAYRAKQMFDWAHLLHRQIYDIYADERIPADAKAPLVERITDYYLSNRALAFAVEPKSMGLMDEAYYSQVFRKEHPKFNGLIWAYHWLQVGLYEPLIGGATPAERRSGLLETVTRFRAMLDQPPSGFPKVMPMTAAVAPAFAARHQRAAIIFDNLHMMHDIISDILASDKVPANRKAREIEVALGEFRDGTKNTISIAEWREMGEMMGGVAQMGGVAWRPPRRP